jgi:hypothetical protein
MSEDLRTFMWLRVFLACSVVASVITCDLLDPLIAISVVIFAVVARSVSLRDVFHIAHTVENMETTAAKTNTSTNTSVPSTGSVLQHIEMPLPANLKYFACPGTVSGTEPERVLDLVDQTGAFRLEKADALSPKWTGPKTSDLLPPANGHEPRLSVFITLDGRLNGDTISASEEERASLFLAYASDPDLGAQGETSEKVIQLSIHEIPNGTLELRGEFGSDSVNMPYPPPLGPRTHYLIRDESYLRIGFFDPINNSASESSQVQATSPALLPNEQFSRVNATERRIGRIYSVVVYNTGMSDYLTGVRQGLTKHTMLRNDMYRKIHDDLEGLRADIQKKKTTPLFSGLNNACPEVSDWTSFDPVGVSPECRDAIKVSCDTDSSQPNCKCWNEQYSLKDSPACVAMRAVFGKVPTPAPSASAVSSSVQTPVTQTNDSSTAATSGPTVDPSTGTYVRPPSWWTYLTSPN